MRRPSISIRALIVGIAAGAPAPALATAVCGNFSANQHYFVGAGQSCTAPAGSYTPVATGTTILPFNDPGYGFVTYAGGQLTTRGAVTIATPASAGATAALSTGAGSLITLTNGATLTTTAANANGVQADTGGAVTLGAAAVTTTVTTSGAGALGLYSTGANSQINATNVAVSTSGVGANAAFATSGGAITLNGGSAQTGGLDAYALAVGAGGTMQATGTAVTTTGAGSGGISVNGSTASFTGSNLTINITGATDTVNQFFPTGLDNQSYKTDVGGGTATLTNSAITVAANGGSGVFTTNAGSTTIIGGSVATSGVAAYGVLGEGGSATTLTGVTIGSTGAGGRGVVFEGAGTTLNGAGLTISTAGNYSSGEADAVYVNSGAAATLSNSQLTTTGNAAKGINVEGTATTFNGYNLTISTSGTIDAGTGFHAQGVYNGSAASPGTGTTGGGVVYLENTSVTTAGAIAYGVDTDNKGTTTFVGGRIATSGAGAIALLSSNGASVTVTPFMQEGEEAPFGQAIGTVISTSAASTEAAVANTGSTMSITGATLSTTGAGAIALAVNDAGTHVTLTDVVINTTGNVDPGTGDAADGVYNGPSSKGTSGGSVTLNNVQVTTTGTSADGIATYTGGVTTVNGGSLTTSGAAAYAAVVHNTGSLSLDNVTISTSGNGSGGVGINGAGASATLTNVSITTTGGFDSASGQHAYGVYNGPYGSLASGGVATITDSSVQTAGFQMHGVVSSTGATTTFLGGSIATTGDQANAALAENGGSLTIGVDADNQKTTLSTEGAGAYAVIAASGGKVSLTGASINTSGDGSGGLGVNGSGSEIDATGVTIATTGGQDETSGLHAYGAYNGPNGSVASGGVLNLTNVDISTLGAGIYGVFTGAGGATSFNGGSVMTSSDDAHAVIVSGTGAVTTLAGTINLTTTGNGAAGIVAANGGVVNGTGAVSITTSGTNSEATGLSSFGVVADGAGSSVTLNAVTIATAGQGAVGLLASDLGETGSGGVITVNGPLTVTTQQAFAYDAFATGPGAKIALNGTTVLNVGAGSFGLYATGGGVITTGGGLTINAASPGFGGGVEADEGSSITLGGASTVNLTSTDQVGLFTTGTGAITTTANLTVTANDNVAVDAQGGVITLGGTSVISANQFGIVVVGASESGPAGFVSAPGTLSLTTTGGGGAALVLTGDGASFSGAGGGTISAAGDAIAFLNGANQSATFTNYSISSPAGDLIFVDPSTATINFNNSVANAGGNKLADVTEGSNLTLNANASAFVGVVQTEAGATSALNLSNGSNWSITGDSTVTNLSLNRSSAGFSAPSDGGFKTLTVTNYSGANASLTFNAMLGGANPAADELVINGGRATGTTKISINTIAPVAAENFAVRAAAAAPPPPSVPIIVTTNGGTIAPGAFTLAAPVMSGGYIYTLQAEDGGEFLVAGQGLSQGQASASLASLAKSRESQAITSRVLSSILTGATEQMNCSSCSSGFASFGSFAFGAHGRWTLSPSLAVLGGASYDSYSARGVSVTGSIQAAVALRYDMVELGRYRPFFEAGLAVSPMGDVKYARSYVSSLGGSTGNGDTQSRSVAIYGRAGYIWRLSPKDEAAAYTDLTRSWQSTSGYLEGATGGNPFGALILPGLDTMNIWKIGAQYTHLFGEHIEANVSAGFATAFGANYGSSASITGFGDASGSAPTSFDWAELGGRVSYRFSKNLIGDLFVLGTVGAEPAGSQIHGGAALRVAF